MLCIKYGNKINENENFCANCVNKNKKKILFGIILMGIVLIIILCIRIIKTSNPKYDPKPRWMVSNTKNFDDYSIAKKYIKEIEKKHNTKFHIMGYGHHYNNLTRENVLMTIYVYSDEYPQVYVSYCVNNELCDIDKDNYLNEISSWKYKNLIYDIAEELNIDTNKIALYVGISSTENSIYGDLLVNNSIDVQTIEKLLSTVKEKNNFDYLEFPVYFVEKGNNRKFKDYMQGILGLDESKLDLSFGNWKKYVTVMNESNIELKLKWEHK